MRALRTTLAAASFFALSALGARADVTVKQLMDFHPSFKGVEYELPTDPAAIAACKAESIPGGFQLRDGQGKVLCRLVDRNADGKLDQWSYYQDGFEIYREIDNNNDRSIDEVRWMNGGGTRAAKVVGGKLIKVTSWTRLSAEEASKVFVTALVSGDSDLLESVMATPAELEALGIPKGEVDQVAAAEKQRVAQIKALRAGLTGWDANTTWLGLNGAMPHLIPAESGLKDDIILCESATIFAASPANQANPGKVAFLQVGEMIRLGEVWKFVDLPRVVDPAKNGVIAAAEGGIRSWVFRTDANAPAGGENPAVAQAMQELIAYDNSKESQALQASAVPKDSARFHVGRVTPLRKIVKAAETAGDARIELDHQKLIVDSISAAYATGQYADGSKVLADLAAKGGKIGTYAAFKQIEADFVLQNSANPGDGLTVQEKWLANLAAFVEKNPSCDEAPQALLLLASTNELNGKEAEGKKSYAVLAKDYPTTEWGKKAAGALRRLDLVGKPMVLKATDLRGQSLDAAQYRGKTLLVTFWATMAGPARRDLPELVKLHAKYKAKGFEVISVNLDNDRADLDAFLQATPLPWPQIFEPGGLDSRPAVEFGVISLPTMILVDPDGKVSNRTLRTASELEAILEKTLTGKVALAPGN
jgi:thiol-disulfide isomerase/thioredoxin